MLTIAILFWNVPNLFLTQPFVQFTPKSIQQEKKQESEAVLDVAQTQPSAPVIAYFCFIRPT